MDNAQDHGTFLSQKLEPHFRHIIVLICLLLLTMVILCFRALQQADLVVLLGARLNWILHFGKPPRYADNVKIIQIDICQEELNNNSNSCVGLHGDIKAVVRQVCASVFVLQVATPVSVTCCWYQMVLHHVRSWI